MRQGVACLPNAESEPVCALIGLGPRGFLLGRPRLLSRSLTAIAATSSPIAGEGFRQRIVIILIDLLGAQSKAAVNEAAHLRNRTGPHRLLFFPCRGQLAILVVSQALALSLVIIILMIIVAARA